MNNKIEKKAQEMILKKFNEYGDPIDMLCNIARKWTSRLPKNIDYSFSAADIALMMSDLKTCRLDYKNKEDSVIDKVAYDILAQICKGSYHDKEFTINVKTRALDA